VEDNMGRRIKKQSGEIPANLLEQIKNNEDKIVKKFGRDFFEKLILGKLYLSDVRRALSV